MFERITKHIDPDRMLTAGYRDDVPLVDPTTEKPANVVTSLLPNGLHAPVLDLDVPAMLVPSSTSGHSHLYLDVQMPWERYWNLLMDLEQASVIQRGFLEHAHDRGLTVVRMPWFNKKPTTFDAPRRDLEEVEPF